MTKLFQLCKNDWVKGLIVAALTAFIAAIQQAIATKGVDFNAFDWNFIGNVTWIAALGYISKNLGTDEEGKFAGAINVEK